MEKTTTAPGQSSTIEALFKDAGVSLAPTAEETAKADQQRVDMVKGVVEREAQVRQKALDDMKMNAMENAQAAVQTVAGIGVGIGDILTNVYNGIVGLADGAENYAASKGYGAGDILSEQSKIKNPLAIDDEGRSVDFGKGGDITRAVTNFAGPMLATMASGGGFLAGAGVNAAYNYLAIDPESQRLSDHLKGTFVEDVPIAASLVDYLQTKPGDSEMTGRWKNFLEGTTIDVGIGGMLWGASRAYSGVRKLRNSSVIDEATSKLNAVEANAATPKENLPTQTARGTEPPPKVEAEASARQAEEAAQAANEESFTKFKQENPAVVTGISENGSGANGIDSEAFIEWAANRVRSNDEAFKRGPVSDAAVAEGASKLTKEQLTEVLTWRPGVGRSVPGPEQLMALKVVQREAATNVVNNLRGLNIENLTDDQLLAFTRDMDNLLQLDQQVASIASEQGRAFRINQVLPGNTLGEAIEEGLPATARDVTPTAKAAPTKDDLRPSKVLSTITGLSEEESLKAIGELGRADMLKQIYKKHGGREGMKDTVTKMKILQQQATALQYPDEAFVKMIGQIERISPVYGKTDAATKTVLNWWLSSPITWGKAFLSNAMVSAKNVTDNYIALGITKASGGLVNVSSQTLEEVNAQAIGALSSLYEAFGPAWKAFKSKGDGVASKFDLQGAPRSTNVEDISEKAGLAWAESKGLADKAVDVLTAGEAPRRIMMGVDSYMQHVTSTGIIKSEAVRAGRQAGLSGDELSNFVEAFIENPTPAVLEKSKYVAETSTFAKNLEGNYQHAQNLISAAGNKFPILRILAPFTKTGFNVMEWSIQNSPLAYTMDSGVKQAIATGGRVREDAIKKIIGGTLPTMGLVGLAANGMIKGESIDAKSYRSERALEGSIPKGAAIKDPLTGTWVEIPKGLSPLTTAINVADLVTKIGGYVNDEEYGHLANGMRVAVAAQMEATGLAEQFSGLLNVFNPGEKDALSAVAGDLTSATIPMSGLLRTVRKVTDDTKRDTRVGGEGTPLEKFQKELIARYKNVIPGLSNDLPAARNLWGDEIKIPNGLGPDIISPVSTAQEGDLDLKRTFEAMEIHYDRNKDRIAGISRVPVEMPPKSISNPFARDISYEFTPEEYSRFTQLNAGIDPLTGSPIPGVKPLKAAIRDIMDRYDAIGGDLAEMHPMQYSRLTGELSQTFMSYRDRAKLMISHPKYSDIRDKMADQAQKFMNRGMGVADGSQ